MKNSVFAMVMVAGLAACGDRPQELTASKQDSAAYTGTGKPYVQRDWKPGDKASWESQLKARNQYGQNDYTRMN
ncbi:MAG: hypothetical protein PSV24_03205 [Rhodoferax sp.]|nr:hypothetical protein [Rhodoferax sp.]